MIKHRKRRLSLRKLADRAWAQGNKELSESLHKLARHAEGS